MANVVVTIKIMPDAEANLEDVQKAAEQAVTQYSGETGKTELEPIAFGIKAIKIIFVMDEAKGSTEPLEAEISKLSGVASVQVVDVRRTIG